MNSKMPIVTQEHIDEAKKANACSALPAIGTPINLLKQDDLIWFEDSCPDLAARVNTPRNLPLWACSDSGYGFGDGDGYGFGYGDGSGYGDCDIHPDFKDACKK